MQTRKITEGAMLSAIIGVVLFLDRQTAGMFNYALYWIIPTPMIIYIAKYNIKDAMMPMTTIAVLALIIGTPVSVYYVIMANLIATWYGFSLKKQKENHILLLQSCIISILSSFITMFLFASLFGYDLSEEIVLMKETLTSMTHLFPNDYNMESLFALLPAVTISTVVLNGVMEGILIHLITTVVLVRLKFPVKPMKSLFQLKLSKTTGLVGVISLFLCLLGSQTLQNVSLANMCVFGYLLFSFLFLANGYLSILTILAYYNKRKYMLLAVLLFPFLLILGILDSILNVREMLTIQKGASRHLMKK